MTWFQDSNQSCAVWMQFCDATVSMVMTSVFLFSTRNRLKMVPVAGKAEFPIPLIINFITSSHFPLCDKAVCKMSFFIIATWQMFPASKKKRCKVPIFQNFSRLQKQASLQRETHMHAHANTVAIRFVQQITALSSPSATPLLLFIHNLSRWRWEHFPLLSPLED